MNFSDWFKREYMAEYERMASKYQNDTHFMFCVVPRVVCNDGFSMSVQASAGHYCRPREMIYDPSGFIEFEIGYPSEAEPLIMEYAEDERKPTETVYGWVPLDMILQVVEKHGGIEE